MKFAQWALTAVLVVLLVFVWFNAMRPEPGKPRTEAQNGVCFWWKELGRPCL